MKIAKLNKPLVNRITGHGEERVDQMLANPLNFRLHPDNQQQALAGAIDDIGFIRSVTVNKRTRRVVDGHLRVTIAARSNVETLPVEYVDLSEEEEAQALLSLDPIAAMAASEKAKLDELMRAVQSDDERVQQMMSEIAEREGLYNQEKTPRPDPGDKTDTAAECQEKWQVKNGDLWVLGEHRLLCGDCTDRQNISRLLRGDSVDAVVTDPPYGVGVDYGLFQDTPDNVAELIKKVMPIILEFPAAAFTPGVPSMWMYPQPVWVGAWVHPAPSGGCPFGFNGMNPILYYGADPYLKEGRGRRPDCVVMASDRQGEVGHPTPKPVKVWEWLIEKMTTEPGKIVFDPFNGSGTTIIVCENLGRKARAMDIEPKYVASTLERWHVMTGKMPELVQDS